MAVRRLRVDDRAWVGRLSTRGGVCSGQPATPLPLGLRAPGSRCRSHRRLAVVPLAWRRRTRRQTLSFCARPPVSGSQPGASRRCGPGRCRVRTGGESTGAPSERSKSDSLNTRRLSIATAMLLVVVSSLAGCSSQGDSEPVVINQTAVPPLPTLEAARGGRGSALYAHHCPEGH